MILLHSKIPASRRLATFSLQTAPPVRHDFLGNVERNKRRNARGNWPAVYQISRGGTAIVVGSGPSMNIDQVLSATGDIIAVGKKAATALNAAGVLPDYLVLTSPQKDAGLPPAKAYLIADHCDPALFVRGKNIRMFKCGVAPGGGVTVYTLPKLGYRNAHLHGLDSSYDEGPLLAKCDGQTFRTSQWLASQIRELMSGVYQVTELLGSVAIYGDGLMQTLFGSSLKDPTSPASEAVFNCAAQHMNFDFIVWLVAAELTRRIAGCNEPLRVHLANTQMADAHKQSSQFRQSMLDNVMRPAMRMLGAIEGNMINTDRVHHFAFRPITYAARAGWKIPKFQIPEVTPDPRLLTITLRETQHIVERNSNVTAWLAFARRRRDEGYRVVFVRDTAKADKPLEDFETSPHASRDLLERMKLYASALCNLCRDNGPTAMMYFTDCPFLMFTPLAVETKEGWHGPQFTRWWQDTADITPPENFPWFTALQRIEFIADTEENIEWGWGRWIENTRGGKPERRAIEGDGAVENLWKSASGAEKGNEINEEHSLGKGEVVSSILTGSTKKTQ